MISYMVDGQGFLIISREVVSEDVEVREKTQLVVGGDRWRVTGTGTVTGIAPGREAERMTGRQFLSP